MVPWQDKILCPRSWGICSKAHITQSKKTPIIPSHNIQTPASLKCCRAEHYVHLQTKCTQMHSATVEEWNSPIMPTIRWNNPHVAHRHYSVLSDVSHPCYFDRDRGKVRDESRFLCKMPWFQLDISGLSPFCEPHKRWSGSSEGQKISYNYVGKMFWCQI